MSSFWDSIAGLVNAALWLYFWLMVIALAASWLAFDPFHPAQALLRPLRKVTEPVVDFFSRTLRLYRLKSPFLLPVVVLAAIFFLRLFLSQAISDLAILGNPGQFVKYLIGNCLLAVLATLSAGLNVYFWIIIAAAIISWIPLDPYHPVTRPLLRFLHEATEPVLRFLRQTLQLHRYTASLDFTPMIAIFGIYLLQNVIIRSLMHWVFVTFH